MLITVKRSKFVLGRTVYLKGDVFECRDAEANLLIAGGMATKSPPGAKATKGPPTAPTIGVSTAKKADADVEPDQNKKVESTPESSASRAPRGRRQAEAPAKQAEPKPAETEAKKPEPAKPAGNPVGAMTMPSSGRYPAEQAAAPSTGQTAPKA